MTLREFIERIERESLHPQTLELPINFVRRRTRKHYPDEETFYEVEDIRVSTDIGVEIRLRPEDAPE